MLTKTQLTAILKGETKAREAFAKAVATLFDFYRTTLSDLGLLVKNEDGTFTVTRSGSELAKVFPNYPMKEKAGEQVPKGVNEAAKGHDGAAFMCRAYQTIQKYNRSVQDEAKRKWAKENPAEAAAEAKQRQAEREAKRSKGGKGVVLNKAAVLAFLTKNPLLIVEAVKLVSKAIDSKDMNEVFNGVIEEVEDAVKTYMVKDNGNEAQNEEATK